MRILGACICFLAGKLRHVKRMLLTEFQKTLTHAYFVFKSFGGKTNKIEWVLPRK